VFAVKV